MQPYDEQTLMAYADGELPPAEAQALAAAAADDPALARRIERYAATRRILQDRYTEVIEAPMPQRLRDLLAEPAATVTALRTHTRRRRTWLPLALAASVLLVVGLLSGRLLLQAPDSLNMALETAASGVSYPVASGEIVALSTLQTARGYCREYERSAAGTSTRGLACRDEDGLWTEQSPIATVESSPQEYQTASGETDAAAALQARRLTAEEERRLIQQRWR